jgi:Domain of unknown function (DUF4352)
MIPGKRARWQVLLVMALLVAAQSCAVNTLTPTPGQATSTPTAVVASAVPREPSPTDIPTIQPSPTAPAKYRVGDIIHMGDILLTVLGWEVAPASATYTPDEGKQFMVVDLILVNQSEVPIYISSILQMRLEDATGQAYELDFTALDAAGGNILNSWISAGERLRGQAGFQVPQENSDLVFVFDGYPWRMGKVWVELGSEPVRVAIPSGLPGDQVWHVYEVADIINIGSLAILIDGVYYPEDNVGGQLREGNKLVLVDIVVMNKGERAITISAPLVMFLKDDTGQVYDVDARVLAASNWIRLDSVIDPQIATHGEVVFQVPEDATGLVFVFDGDVWGYPRVFIALP